MTATQATLHRAILEDPLSDEPRLAYADYLDELGQTFRADFIRLQCQWPDREHSEADAGYYEEWCEHWVCVELLNDLKFPVGGTHGYVKHDGLYNMSIGVGGRCLVGWTWRRGFMETVGFLHADDFDEATALKVFCRQPVLKVELHDREPWLGVTGLAWFTERHRQRSDVHEASNLADGIWQAIPQLYPARQIVETGKMVAQHRDGGAFAYSRTVLSDACVAYGRELAGLPALKKS